MNEIRYSHVEGTPVLASHTTQCSYNTNINTDTALVQSAQELSDSTLGHIAALITQRQFVAQKMLDHKFGGSNLDIMANTMDYINDELRKLLCL